MKPESYSLLYLIPLFPLVGATILGLVGAHLSKRWVTTIALASVFGAFVMTIVATWFALSLDAPIETVLWDWIAVGRHRFPLVFGLDRLSAVLMLVVTGVGFLIHVYSVGYMHDDPSYWRYFAYLNFFIFAMSVLALGRSLPVLFIGWEGVGLASYLLIGFWYSDIEKARAGKKAFITNRIGDFGFLVGIMTLVGLFGTADFIELEQAVKALGNPEAVLARGIFAGYAVRDVLTFACISLFVGACGKSAQIPLFVWLPDAMAGPTPVSALIHAATMVTAGVYMVVRLHFLFDPSLTPLACNVVATIGAATAIFAATIGLAQDDIKKVLAYSTVSQLGYMFLAAGLGAYGAAVFHLVTHAFFKACLFLGSGAVIHALHGEQDMRRMGGLAKKIPIVFWTFLFSTLALAGVAPLSGFVSKDAILSVAWEHNRALWALGFAGAGLTALYMARLLGLTFSGSLRSKDDHGHETHVHAPSAWMHIPLIILAALAVVAGAVNLPHVVHLPGIASGAFDRFLEPVVGRTHGTPLDASIEWALIVGSVGLAVACLVVGFRMYRNGPSPAMERATSAGPLRLVFVLLHAKWFIDELYQMGVLLLHLASRLFSVVVDQFLIDGIAVKSCEKIPVWTGRVASRLQTGNVQFYASVLVLAIAGMVLWVVQ